MKINPSLLKPLAILQKHLLTMALVIGVGFVSWLTWQGWTQWSDLPLATDRVTAKQLRVNESQRQTLLGNIKLYQQPKAVPTLPAVTFQGGSGT